MRRTKCRRAAGEGPLRPDAPTGFAKVSKAAGADHHISDATYRVLGLIAGYADEHGYCYPAVGTIARARGVSRQAIQHHLRLLVANGYIEKQVQKRKNGGYGPNLYRVVVLYASNRPQPALGAESARHSTPPTGTSGIAPSARPGLSVNDASACDCIEAAE